MKSFYLGCDVSKGYSDFVIIDQKKQVVESVFQFDDTFEGHNGLFKMLSHFMKLHQNSIMFAAVESTGGLENNWLNSLYKFSELLNIKAARINPVGPVALHKASLERNIDDAISAKKIAEYLIAYPEKIAYNADDPYISLRKQWNLIQMLNKQKTQLLNQLSILIYNSFPFLVKYCKNGVSNWLIELIKKYPSASKLARTKEEIISKIPYITKKRASEIISNAKNSIGAVDDETASFVIKSTLQQIKNLTNMIEENKRYMTSNCNLPEVELLTSMKGIGIYSAVGLVLNIISVERFPSAKHLASYFGIHPVYKESGDKSGAYRMSKKGRVVPRQILFMVARSAIIYNPLIKDIFIDHIKKGKSKMSAIGVCMHKILRIVYGMLKRQQKFDPEVDKRNKNNTKTVEVQKQHSDKKRRFQEESNNAPISRKQTINRKKRKQSQSITDGEYEIIAPSSSS